MESANKMNAGSESNCVHEQVAKADCECPIYITYTNVNGYLIPNLTYKSGEQMEQPGKDGFLRRDYLKNHRNSMYQVMLPVSYTHLLWYELHYHKTGRNAVDIYRIICIRDESVQDSEANTLCSFASVPILA